MFGVSLARSIHFALQSFRRNIWLSLVSIFIICLTLMIVNVIVMLNILSDAAVTAVKEKINVTVFFYSHAKETDVFNVKNSLEQQAGVKSVIYNSKNDNLEKFKAEHANDPQILTSIDAVGGNPLGATLNITAATLDDYPKVIGFLNDPAYDNLIEDKNFEDHAEVISRISGIATKVQQGGLALGIVFIIIVALIVFNTIRIAIFTHRSEIGVMKLVGADNWFVRSPFVLESILYAILSWVLVVGLTIGLSYLAQPYLAKFFEGAAIDLPLYLQTHFVEIFLTQLGAMVVLVTVTSTLAVSRYLRV